MNTSSFHPDVDVALPLLIEVATWNEVNLLINGGDWNLLCQCPWRVVDSEKMVFGCYETLSRDQIKSFEGKEIVRVEAIEPLRLDPRFCFSDGSNLELFSTDAVEPWVFRTPEVILVASPTDPNAFIK